MRSELKKINGKYRTFIAIIGKRGSYLNAKKKIHLTICLENVSIKGSDLILTDHLWIKRSNDLKGIQKGSKIKFTGCVTCYYKSGKVKDYCIKNISRIRLMEE